MTGTTAFIQGILLRLRASGFPDALVAGGCLRDIDTGRSHLVKDIDVFIQDHSGYLAKLISALPEFTYRLAVPKHVAQYMEFEGVVSVHEFTKDGYPPLQIVVMKTPVNPQATIERHDFGICQVGYDGHVLYTTPAYQKDRANHTFTISRCRNQKDFIRSMRRWARLSEKFPEWTCVYDDAAIRP